MRIPFGRGAMRIGWVVHRAIWRASGGRLGARVLGLPVLELTTIGHRSGEERRVLLSYLDHERGFVILGSNAGADRDPAWWTNLRATPEGRVRSSGGTTPVRAMELEGAEREEQWRRAVAANGDYARYQAATERRIPVVLLERLG